MSTRTCEQVATRAGAAPIAVLATLLATLAGMLGVLPSTAGAATLPPGFREDTVLTGLTSPTAMAFSPDGRIFVAEKQGLIKVFSGLSDTSPDVVADLRTNVHNYWDRGLLGLALHPNFPATDAIYALYTYDAPIGGTAPKWGDACADPTGNGCVVSGRLSRLTNIGGAASAVAEQVLINDWCQQYPSHSIGSLSFGPDGALYVSGGDGANFNAVDYGQFGSPKNPCGDPPGGVGGAMTPPSAEGGALRSQDLRTPSDPTTLDGAILRLDPETGAGLPDNPLASSSDPNARRIIAHGLRNPFRMTFRPGTGELWVGDVGASAWEEINRITDVKGAVENFGWPCYEGDRTGSAQQSGYKAAGLKVCQDLYAQPGAVTAPYISYKHRENIIVNEACPLGGSSIAGLAFQFYTGGPYPPEYDGALFFADYSRNCIWVVGRGGTQLPSPSNIKSFVGGATGPVQLTMSPSGELFYVSLSSGSIRRIRYTAPLPSGSDKALGRPATASSTEGPGREPGKAVDGNATTRWASAESDDEWWQVDLGTARQVDRVRVDWETAYAAEYAISTSTDGTAFTAAANVNIAQAGAEVTSFAARRARYVRITGVRRGTPWGYSIWDANVYGPADDSNSAPTAKVAATPTSGDAPLRVDFDATGSTDPDGDTLSYDWDLDGDGLFGDATAGRPAWTYEAAGTYTARVRVSDGNGGTDTATSTIGVGLPKPTISAPATSLRWAVGEAISFSGSAVDNRGEPIPASGLSWSLALEHGACPECHEHVLQGFPGVAGGTFTAPDHEYPSELKLTLTATDGDGRTASTSIRLLPRTVDLTVASAPTGLQLGFNGGAAAAPSTRRVIVGSVNTISAPAPQTLGSTSYAFGSWSDGGAQTHTIKAPATATTYTATFTSGPADKALNRPATASSTDTSAFLPGKAVDGSSTTRWSSEAADNQWWQVDLGTARHVDSVRINWEAAYAKSYRISTSSDGSSWSTAATVNISTAGPRTTSFAARTVRYVRITGITRATPWGISFWDVNVYGPADTTLIDKALYRPARASSTQAAGYEAGKAVDNSSTTRWSSTATNSQWWEVDLGSSQHVSSVRITWASAYASKYRISTATTAGTWSTVTDVTTSGSGLKTTTFTGRRARWVRITGLTRATSGGISFWTANVMGAAGP